MNRLILGPLVALALCSTAVDAYRRRKPSIPHAWLGAAPAYGATGVRDHGGVTGASHAPQRNVNWAEARVVS